MGQGNRSIPRAPFARDDEKTGAGSGEKYEVTTNRNRTTEDAG